MDVLILSKTHMNGKSCVGGITGTGRYVRLLDENGNNQPEDTELQPRHVWKIKFTERENKIAPHVEDVLIQSKELKGPLNKKVKIKDFLKERKIPVWGGTPDALFDELIQWTTSGSGFIGKNKKLPEHSVGFWISDKDLKRRDYNGIRYNYPNENAWRSLKYVGFDEPVDLIPSGTLIRVSLARWWKQNADTEERCFLQLSGWYDL